MVSRGDHEIAKTIQDHQDPIFEKACVPSTSNIQNLCGTEKLAQYDLRFRPDSNTMDIINNEKCVESDSDMFEGLDDSDNDPDFNVSSYSTDEDIEKLASIIENNISEKTVLDHSLPQTSLQQNGSQNKTVNKTKTRNNKTKECLPLTECKKKCNDKISYEQQLTIFNYYKHLSSYQSKASFVSRLIDMQPVKRMVTQKSVSSPRNRTHSNYYSLLVNGTKINVCQKCFLKTLGETDSFLKTVTNKIKLFGMVEDNRGKGPSANKLSEEKINEVRNHINTFPYYESHYTRRRSQKKYLQCNLNLSTMFRLYSTSHSNPVSLTKYNQNFKAMGLKFKKPKADTCFKSDKFKMLINVAKSEDEKNNLILQQSNHHKDADLAYNMKEDDKRFAKNNLNTKIYAFDLQQCLPTPLVTSNVCFYKRQLWTFNLTVHNCVSNNPFCYMWHEALAKRGGNEISSCIYQHLLSEPSNVEHVIFYNDGCVGQKQKFSYVSNVYDISAVLDKYTNNRS